MTRSVQTPACARPSAPVSTGSGRPAGPEAAVEALLDAVRAGRAHQVPELLEPLDAAARRKALGRLKALRSEVRAWDGKRWDEAGRVRRALYVAGAGCHTDAAATAAWLGGRDLAGWDPRHDALVLSVVADRDAAWMADVAERLAGRRAVAESGYELIHGLVVRSGCPVPATDGYVLGWTRRITGGKLLQRLREDPQTPVLVAHALAMGETPDRLARPVGPEAPAHWPTAITALVAEGVLDRAGVMDQCVSRLLRGGRARDLRFPLEVLRLLAPTGEELRERVPDWVGMAADAPSPVAGYAQEVLAGLAAAGALPAGALAEMTGAVLFRTEKKLVRAQLALVGRVLARDPGAAGELLPAVAEAFGHEDTGVQERALKLVGRYLSAVDAEVRGELAEAAGLLGPAHRRAAAEVFGDALAEAVTGPYEEILPPVPGPEPVAPAASTVAELVEELVEEDLMEDPVAFERAFDGLVRHAHRDRAAVVEAVREAFPKASWETVHRFAHHTHGIHVVLAALLGAVERSVIDVHRAEVPGRDSCAHEGLSGILDARLWEAAALIGTDELPFPLATPTLRTGGIDPLVLVERLRAYRDAGVEPAPVDLAQALVRVLRADPAAGRAAGEAAALGTAAGLRLAAWLRDEDALGATVRFFPRGDRRSSGEGWLIDRIVVGFGERAVVREEFPAAFHWLGGTLRETPRRCCHWIDHRAQWAPVLPADREVLAACLLPAMAHSVDGDQRGATEPLTGLAEAGGPVGRAVHLALAFGLGCVDADDRLRAVDALLVLASRGELNGRALGTELAWLVAEGSLKPNRLTDALRTASATGAYGTVWTVLEAMLPELLGAEKPVRGLGEMLAVAADCVERCGARGGLAGLEGVASARGSSQLVVQAGRLLNALGQGADQPLAETA
ncbi:DUF6493 family protein [Streptomyces sp. NPDC001744]|uniref:DUF7824 domain-containing protein n=1 Tax=Streptomyces sp. NPDC001744 TaxID=3364606 RepID=UPI00368C86AF